MKFLHPSLALFLAACGSCGGGSQKSSSSMGSPSSSGPHRYRGGDAGASRAADSSMLAIAKGHFFSGSTPEEREQAYADYRASAGHDAARRGKWFDREEPRKRSFLPAFRIDSTPVTVAAYAEFIADTGRAAPNIDKAAWRQQRFSQDYDSEVARFNWSDGVPPKARADHPVVLVTWADASTYCQWRGAVVGESRRLPTAAEFEKSARGEHGFIYPWGNDWDANKLNSQAAGPDDTVAVGSFPSGASPFGMLDAAGNVFQWTSTPWPYRPGSMTVKGSAWDDYAGVGRGASQHGRRKTIHHAIVGFRCAADAAH